MQCQHDGTAVCAECSVFINICCGEDERCDECKNTFCRKCYDKYKRSALCCEVENNYKCSDHKYGKDNLMTINVCEKEVAVKIFSCPCCDFTIITDIMLIEYLLARVKLSREEAEQRCRKYMKKSNKIKN